KYLEKFFIVRTAWVFGKNGNNFVKTMLRLGSEKPELRVVSDQFGSPTYTEDLGRLVCDMIETNRYGIYHATNEGFCNWFEFASEIMKQSGLGAKVLPVTSEEYPTKAIRPKNSRLSKESLDANSFSRLPPWENALERYLDEN
ncbi:MAG: sugar nucleotide-binding protein, partial [Oscillospiraceae bacterium]|nr:sugar nucleotide-binding protein [Oscillospiraceae bacterium]